MPDIPIKKQRSFSPMEYDMLKSEGLAPEGLPRQCPKCGIIAHYKQLDKKKRGTCCEVECPSCFNHFEIIKGLRQ